MLLLSRKISLWFICFLSITLGVNAQSILGKWQTYYDDSGKPKSIIEISQSSGIYTAKVVVISDPERAKLNLKCVKCNDDRKNQPMMGLEIIRGMKSVGSNFEGGTILDPSTGKIYTSKMWLEGNDILKVRGYVGMFYRTQTWKRVK